MTPLYARDAPCNPDLRMPDRISASPDIIPTGLPGTNDLTEPPDIIHDHLLRYRWRVADAHADGSHELDAVRRFLAGWKARRQRGDRQAREDLERRDRRRGEQPCVHLVKREIGLGFQGKESRDFRRSQVLSRWWFAGAHADGALERRDPCRVQPRRRTGRQLQRG